MGSLDDLVKALKLLDEASKFTPVAQLEPAISVLTSLVESIKVWLFSGYICATLLQAGSQTTIDNRETAAGLNTRSTQLINEIADILRIASKDHLREFQHDLSILLASIKDITARTQKILSRSRWKRFLRNETDKALLAKLDVELKNAMDHFMFSNQTFMRRDFIIKARDDLIDKLPIAEADFDSKTWAAVSACYPGTRVETLKAVQDWLDDTSDSCRRIFWLHGPPGIGKTAVSKSVAARSATNGQLGASFFFSRSKQAIAEAIARDSGVVRKAVQNQADSLFFQPLSSLETPLPHTIIVVDGLDECHDHAVMQDILHILVNRLPALSPSIKLFLASRPEHHISTILSDIAGYLRNNLTDLALKHAWPTPWPPEDDLWWLVSQAGGLFIFATTLVRFAESVAWKGPVAILRAIHGDRTSEMKPLAEIDRLYQTILDSSPPAPEHDRVGFLWNIRQVLTALVVYEHSWTRPMSISLTSLPRVNTLVLLLAMEIQQIQDLLQSLQSLLNFPTHPNHRIRSHHRSFIDFLTGQDRCSQDFFISFSPESGILEVLRSWFSRCNLHKVGFGDPDFLGEPISLVYCTLCKVTMAKPALYLLPEQTELWSTKLPMWLNSLRSERTEIGCRSEVNKALDLASTELNARIELLVYIYAVSLGMSAGVDVYSPLSIALVWPHMLNSFLTWPVSDRVKEPIASFCALYMISMLTTQLGWKSQRTITELKQMAHDAGLSHLAIFFDEKPQLIRLRCRYFNLRIYD
ncbi:hypothetical protein K474DRAFT_1707787 [Panus rudis PR-1116 ss-1]|nr:hypothetical protein K474DRAFT_1707787 [Panus rudis PR-1116 ss-1]